MANAIWPPRSEEELIEFWRALRRKERDGYVRWDLLIRELRVLHHVCTLEAERIALSNKHRRRWAEKQINSHRRGRKCALTHVRLHGDAALIAQEGDIFRFKMD